MKGKIKSISEAFSMQPVTISVSETIDAWNTENCIKRIELEVLDENTNIYVGYNFKGQKKFGYLEKSVNVHYF